MKKTLIALALLLSVALPARAQDMFNLSTATIQRSVGDVASWPITNTISAVTINNPGNGIGIQTATPLAWPSTPDLSGSGGMGPLQYTVWVCVTPASWQCMGVIQMWNGRNVPPDGSLPALPSNWSLWWGPTAGGATGGGFGSYVPQPGDTIGLFLAAGDERGGDNVTVVKARTNVVTFTLVAGDTQSLTFSGQPAPTPTPSPAPTPTPSPTPGPTWDEFQALQNQVTDIQKAVTQLQTDLANASAAEGALAGRVTTLEGKVIPMSCSASVFGVPIHCALK